MDWQYVQPVEILFRRGGFSRLGELCAQRNYRRGVLVCDPYFVESGKARSAVEASGGRLAAVFSGVTPNPRTREVDECAALMRRTGADFAVALGGGSAIDCAKAACAIAPGKLSTAQAHTGGAILPDAALPLVAVPTTAGTGSEVTGVAVLTDEEKGVKAPLGHRNLYPALALIDAELTVSLPPAVTAATGLDALSHALEAFWSKNHQPVCDALALAAARLCFEWLPRAYAHGDDIKAREKMCEASVLAGLAFALPKTAAAHAISFPLTNRYGLPHGEACAFTLDALCEINAQAEGGRLEGFARQLGFESAAAMGARIAAMKREMGMRCTLAQAGIPMGELPELARLSQHPNLDNNPVPLGEADLIALFTGKA